MNPMMATLFEKALGVTEPWYVEGLEFSAEAKRLDIRINFREGSRFAAGGPDRPFPVHDTVMKSWRHLNFFEHECYLHCRVPRVRTDDGQTLRVKVPWEGVNSGFTMLFEALLLQLCTQMTVNETARIVGEDDEKIWRVLHKYIDQASESADLRDIKQVGVDETSKGKGHDYVTVVVDLERRETIFVAEGRTGETLKQFMDELESHGGDRRQISDFTCDMSGAYIKGIAENFPNAQITYDKFHLIKMLNDAVNAVRQSEVSRRPILKKSRWLMLKNSKNLNGEELRRLDEIRKWNLDTCKALQFRENFQAVYHATEHSLFKTLLNDWLRWAKHSRVVQIREVAKTFQAHIDGILKWYDSRLSNGILEGINSLIQAAKRKARGFKLFKNFRAAIMLMTGNLDFSRLNPSFRPL